MSASTRTETMWEVSWRDDGMARWCAILRTTDKAAAYARFNDPTTHYPGAKPSWSWRVRSQQVTTTTEPWVPVETRGPG